MKAQITVTIIVLALIGIGVYSTWEYVLVADFLTQLVAGAILLTPFIAIWGFKPLIEKYRNSKSKPQKQYNAKKLNDEVFRKLMRVGHSTNPMWFTNELGFIIPTNKEEFYNKESSEYYECLSSNNESFEQTHSKIDVVIPNLKIGEQYLKKSYPDIFDEWNQIKQTVNNYNKKYHSCVADFAKQAEKKIVLDFPTFHHNEKSTSNELDDSYFFENIGNSITESINNGINVNNIKLSIGEFLIDRNYWILAVSDPNYNLMGSYEKNKFDINKLEKILCDIIKNPDNIIQYQKSREIDFTELYERIDRFCNNLEQNVVNDIDAQIIS